LEKGRTCLSVAFLRLFFRRKEQPESFLKIGGQLFGEKKLRRSLELVSEQRPRQTSTLLQSPFVHFGAALANASAFALGQQ
jgi:hypothetical protein